MMTDSTDLCPICGEGRLHPKIGKNPVEYKGETTELAIHFSLCDACGSEQADPAQTRANKRLMIAFKKRVDGLLAGGEVRVLREKLGLSQAEATARSLARAGLRFSALYSSDLERARQTAAAIARAHAPLPASVPTLIIDRPMRSGQQAYARGGDLVVLAAVNAGAEVIADGSIHIYAPLRGRALAGAQGDTGARIFTTCFEAELVSIAGVYRTFETGIPDRLAARPAQVQFSAHGEENRLDIVALKTD